MSHSATAGQPPAARPSAAGMYDYFLGGTANTAVDRAAAERVREQFPDVSLGAWANRGFLQRAVRHMAGELGIRQFLDLGAGLPTQRHTHETLASIRPDHRVVYVDHDPDVIERGRAMLATVPQATAILADMRDVQAILDHPETRELIDFSEPVGVLMVAVLHFIPDADDPWALVRRYMRAAAAGSCLALSVGTDEGRNPRRADGVTREYRSTATPPTIRPRDQVRRFFDGLRIVPPYPGAEADITHVGLWGAEDPEAADDDGARIALAALGVKP